MAVLTEDAVIGYVCDYLAAQGWEIVSRAMPAQHGTDIVAVRGGIRLEAEAKGARSSKAHTARYGQPFNTAQVKVHVGEAVLKALRVVAAGQARAAIAFPVTPRNRAEVTAVQPALASLGITVFWVADDGTVTQDGPGSSKPHA